MVQFQRHDVAGDGNSCAVVALDVKTLGAFGTIAVPGQRLAGDAAAVR